MLPPRVAAASWPGFLTRHGDKAGHRVGAVGGTRREGDGALDTSTGFASCSPVPHPGAPRPGRVAAPLRAASVSSSEKPEDTLLWAHSHPTDRASAVARGDAPAPAATWTVLEKMALREGRRTWRPLEGGIPWAGTSGRGTATDRERGQCWPGRGLERDCSRGQSFLVG